MVELYDKKLWTDVKFHCNDHHENDWIHAHKIVLAARSPVFQAMFFGPCANGKDDVQLDNTESKILDLFLRYIYCDKVMLAEGNASSVLEMAHYYQVTNLVQFCADYLASIITTQNASEILSLALRYEVATLRTACCNFIDKHADGILKSEGFLELSEECLTYILKGDTFYADEGDIFVKAEEWSKRRLGEGNIEKTGPNIRQNLGASLFHHLRLPTMTYQTLMECTRKKGYFSVEEYEDIVDFINKIPDSSVKSNSCVARLPTEEILEVNNEDDETNISDKITTSFHISVTRDVKLKNVTLTEIYAHYRGGFYSGGQDLPADLNLVISGSLQITCRKIELLDVAVCGGDREERQKENEEVHDGDDEEEEVDDDADDDGSNSNDDDDDEYLIFEQDILLQSTEVKQRVVDLQEPLALTKFCSPFRVTVNLKYSCESGVKMKTFNSSTDTVTNEYGHITVDNISGEFTGINSLGFENTSNRESVK